MLGRSWVAAQLAASQEGLSSMSEWVSELLLNRSLKEGVRRLQCAVMRGKCNSAKTMLRVWVRVNEITAEERKQMLRMALKFISVRFWPYSFVPLIYFFVAINISSVSLRHKGVWWSGNTSPYFTCALDVSQWSASRPGRFRVWK
jgi:hypothetical protein